MGIIKDILKTLFGSSNKQKEFELGQAMNKPTMEVVHKQVQEDSLVEKPLEEQNTPDEKELLEFDSEHLKSKENKMDSQIKFEVSKPTKKKRNDVVGKQTLLVIKQYLISTGSINTITCKHLFGIKSLRNVIWELRKQGFDIKTEKIDFKNELGEVVEVVNYRLNSQTSNGAD